MQVSALEQSSTDLQQRAEASQQALEEALASDRAAIEQAQASQQAALEEKAAEVAQLIEAQNAFYQQYEELTASYQELQGHYETANAQLQVSMAALHLAPTMDSHSTVHAMPWNGSCMQPHLRALVICVCLVMRG